MGKGQRLGVALGGFMGVGKSTVGLALAARLRLPFVDTDAVLVRDYGPIAEQFARGESLFRAREQEVVLALCDGRPRVIATGGGVWPNPHLRRALWASYRMLVLTASLEELRGRVEGGDRPLWDEAVAARYRSRQAAYADAERVIDTTGRELADIIEEIVTWL